MDLHMCTFDTLILREETSLTSVFRCSNGVQAYSIPITSKLTHPPFGKDMTGRGGGYGGTVGLSALTLT